MAGSELYAPLYYLYSTARPIALAAPQRCRRLTSGGRRRKGWLGARQSVSRHRPTARRGLRQAAEHAAHSGDLPPLEAAHPAGLAAQSQHAVQVPPFHPLFAHFFETASLVCPSSTPIDVCASFLARAIYQPLSPPWGLSRWPRVAWLAGVHGEEGTAATEQESSFAPRAE